MAAEGVGEHLKDRIRSAVENANTAVAVNTGEESTHTSVSTKQTITEKDGRTTVTEEREERRNG